MNPPQINPQTEPPAAATNDLKIDLGVVQETLLTPLCARAMQYGRPDAIVSDPIAARLVETIDYDFDRLRAFPDTMTGCAIRAERFDRRIQSFLGESSADETPPTMVLIGEGLDTTFDRNDDGRAHWYEIDFPDVIALRKQLFPDQPRRHQISGSVFDEEWIGQVKQTATERVFFQIAGVMMYLPEEKVRKLFTLLADHFPGCHVAFDTCSVMARRLSSILEASVRTTRAVYQWGITDPRRIDSWDKRLVVRDVEYTMNFHRHRWTRKARLASALFPPLRHAYQLNYAVLG